MVGGNGVPSYFKLEENSQYGLQYLPLDKLARELKKMDLVIPFGNRNVSIHK